MKTQVIMHTCDRVIVLMNDKVVAMGLEVGLIESGKIAD